MPWNVVKEDGKFWVVKEDTGEKMHDKPHMTREEAEKHMKALYSSEGISEAEYHSKKREAKKMPMNEKDMMMRKKKMENY